MIGWFLEFTVPLLNISIIPAEVKLSDDQCEPTNLHSFSKEQLLEEMCVNLAPYIAETLFFNKISTTAYNDLAKITQSAYDMVIYIYFLRSHRVLPLSISARN